METVAIILLTVCLMQTQQMVLKDQMKENFQATDHKCPDWSYVFDYTMKLWASSNIDAIIFILNCIQDIMTS